MHTQITDAFRQCLTEGDFRRMFSLWGKLFPSLPPIPSLEMAEIALHMARTETTKMPLQKRLYSHDWLIGGGLPSKLPDELRPANEYRGSVIVPAVGIAVCARSPRNREHAAALEKAMADAVEECFADGIIDTPRVAARMWEARDRFWAMN